MKRTHSEDELRERALNSYMRVKVLNEELEKRLEHTHQRAEDLQLIALAALKYRFAVFPTWNFGTDSDEPRTWCVAGVTCRDRGGLPDLSKDARDRLTRMMKDTSDKARPGFWRRCFLKLLR